VVAGVAAVLSLSAPAVGAQPRDPGDTAIRAAERDRAGKAAEVGRLAGLVAKADGEARRAQDGADLAVERYNKAVVDLDVATSRAQRAKRSVSTAGEAVRSARVGFGRYARGSYMQGSTVGSVSAALLESGGPTDLLQRTFLLEYVGRRRLDALGELERAKVRQANAESTARRLLAEQRSATDRSQRARSEAAREVAGARSRLSGLKSERAALSRRLETARVRLNGLYAERQRYVAWKRAQEEVQAREAARQRRLRAEAAARAAATDRAARPERRSSGGARPSPAGPVRQRGGEGSPAKGQAVADAALRWLGTPYSWGGGNASGPTYGIDFPGGGAGANDSRVRGFDCSGLTLWAWAQVGVSLPHYSGYQYGTGRRVSRSELMPGDLVYWAYTSDPATIHHVAIYLSGGRVVTAPQSGDIVRIAPMWIDGYLGASRPGT